MPACDPGEIILKDGLILTGPGFSEAIPHSRTVISGERLLVVNEELKAPLPWAGVIDCSNCLIMPGLINAHTHAAMSLLRGIADDLPLDQWLNNYIFPSEARHAGPEFVYLGTRLSAAEMALSGITTFADGYYFMEEAARAAVDVGLRSVIAQGILDVPVPDAPRAGFWKERAVEFLISCPTNPLITPALFCHSAYLCGPETLRGAADMARSKGTHLFCHVSETESEVREIVSRYGMTPVEHLEKNGILGQDFVAVHGVHLSDKEKDMLAESGTKLVHCPESNMKLATGAVDVMDLIRRGITVALGTDGPASNNNLDLFEEMRSASLMAKLISSDPQALDARTALRMATIDGARALGMEDKIGSLEAGKLADVIVIDLDRAHLTPVYDPVSHLVYSARGSDVRDVIVNGRIVVRNGRLMTQDEEELRANVREMAADIGRDLGIGNFKTSVE